MTMKKNTIQTRNTKPRHKKSSSSGSPSNGGPKEKRMKMNHRTSSTANGVLPGDLIYSTNDSTSKRSQQQQEDESSLTVSPTLHDENSGRVIAVSPISGSGNFASSSGKF